MSIIEKAKYHGMRLAFETAIASVHANSWAARVARMSGNNTAADGFAAMAEISLNTADVLRHKMSSLLMAEHFRPFGKVVTVKVHGGWFNGEAAK